MRRALVLWLAFAAVGNLRAAGGEMLHTRRSSAGDLEVGGELRGLAPGATRYIRYADLLRLPQEHYTVSDDANLRGKVEIEGVSLVTLARLLGGPHGDAKGDVLMVAICGDGYRANYPRDYVGAHHPLLVLRINGRGPDGWPASEFGGPLGPYMISHPLFKPAFKVLSHEDEPQVPFGVVRIEMRHESQVFGAIRPAGVWPAGSPVAQGYAIARQDCFRCHNMGAEGGRMAGRPWPKLAEDARQDGGRFRQTIRNPAAVTPGAKMPAHPEYDDATLGALMAYFRTFASTERGKAR